VTKQEQPWGLFATLALGAVALLVGQFAGIAAVAWYEGGLDKVAEFSGDGAAIAILIFTSTPVQVALTALFAQRTGASAADYLGLKWPRRSELIVGVAAAIAFIVGGNLITWLLGRNIVTDFQVDIYRSAGSSLWLALLCFAVVVVTPIGEETLFRGFLFRGWLRSPSDAWLVIIVTAALWALIHVQYDWFVMFQVFVSGLILGWLRWASGSTILTMLLHGLINAEGMIETYIKLNT